MFDKHIFLVIIFVCNCNVFCQQRFPNQLKRAQADILNFNEGETCRDDGDGLLWLCRPIKKCPLNFIASIKTSKPKLCRSSGPNHIYCCPTTDRIPIKQESSESFPPPEEEEDEEQPLYFYPPLGVNPSTAPTPPPPRHTTTTTTTTTTAGTVIKSSAEPVVTPKVPDTTSSSDLGLRISDRKCKEYAAAVFQEPLNAPLSILFSDEKPEKQDTCTMQQMPLIIGGENATFGEFPHQVAIGFSIEGVNNKPEILFVCGGSLISESYIMSAAHCAERKKKKPDYALLGEVTKEGAPDDINRAVMRIKDVVVHPDYLKANNFVPGPYNDIALFLLEEKITFSRNIRPACLQSPNPVFRIRGNKNKALATGWGKTENSFSPNAVSNTLLKVPLDIFQKEKCNEFYSDLPNGYDNDGMVCAGDLTKRRDTCSGDSGGPLQAMLDEPYCMYTIMGITSAGIRGNCGKFMPSIYTRVSRYLPWVESVVWPNEK